MSYCSKQTFPEPDEIKPIILTENAADKVYKIIQEEGNPELKFRAYVESGGCSGFQYGFTLDEEIHPDDYVYSTKQVTLLVNVDSAKVLSGATIDYVEDIGGESFVIHNPNAKKSCSCGTSFDIEE